jgi:hypothetical protein
MPVDNRPGGSYRSRSGSFGQAGIVRKVVAHPFAFGIGSGVVGGAVAALRVKKVSIEANLITAGVIAISEALLADRRDQALPVFIYTALGVVLGMAPFTRWDPMTTAWIERTGRPVRVAV